jgi:hypothetical protein
MAPVPVPVSMVAFWALLRVTVNVSLFSKIVSPFTRTVMVLLVSPGLKVKVPLCC